MPAIDAPAGALNLDLATLRRLAESEEVIRAISEGQVDAFVMLESDQPQVVTLSTAELPYRLLTDRMLQGAVTVSADGLVLYANKPFARLISESAVALPGQALSRFLVEGDAPLFEAVLARAAVEPIDVELAFKREGGSFPARVEAEKPFDAANALCLVVTDLSEQRRHEATMASETLGRSILDQAVDAVIVCDVRGDVIRASKSSHLLCGCNPLLQPFGTAFPLSGSQGKLDLEAILRGEVLRNAEFDMDVAARNVSLLVSAGPVIDPSGSPVASVITMTDVTELKRVEAELMDADARKDEMLAVVVHELANPLSHIGMVAQLLSRDGGAANDTARLRDGLKRSIDHISRLVDDLADFNRIRLHKLRLEVAPCDLRLILARAIEQCQRMTDSKSQRVTTEFGDVPIRVAADQTRLAQVFMNLINNASKFSPPEGDICVRALVDAATAEALVIVADNGMGIAPPMLERIFAAFEQVSGPDNRGGLGVGLTLSRRIVELHGGAVTAASEGPETGSTFTVRLPLLPPERISS